MQSSKAAGRNADQTRIPDEVASVATDRVSAERVYGALADLHRHLVWGGSMHKKSFGLISLDAPAGGASVGTEFTSKGMDLGGTFSDRSVVTEASRPHLFEFVTEGILTKKKPGKPVSETTFTHRYEITEKGEGCGVTYRGHAVRWTNPPPFITWRLMRPVVKAMFASMGKKTLRNILTSADQR